MKNIPKIINVFALFICAVLAGCSNSAKPENDKFNLALVGQPLHTELFDITINNFRRCALPTWHKPLKKILPKLGRAGQ